MSQAGRFSKIWYNRLEFDNISQLGENKEEGPAAMSVRKKKPNYSLELAITWMFGCLLLLVANMTVFRRLDASVGEPWFNYLLGVLIAWQLTVITVRFRRLHKEVKYANSQIERVDGMGDEAFARYVAPLLEKEGWQVTPGLEDGAGALLYLEAAGGRIQAVFHTGRRKLTRDYIAAVGAKCREQSHPGGEAVIWCLTNTSFTSQAQKEAGRLGFQLMDRKRLINRLAKSDSAPIIPRAGRKS